MLKATIGALTALSTVSLALSVPAAAQDRYRDDDRYYDRGYYGSRW